MAARPGDSSRDADVEDQLDLYSATAANSSLPNNFFENALAIRLAMHVGLVIF
jgi:hypothetical protein